MRTIVHLSDLHFGKVHRARLEPLAQAVTTIAPDLVAVSGDLTQRARLGQFREAKSFLATLPLPQVVVPGNHDVPLFNLALRFGDPLGRFRRLHQDQSLESEPRSHDPRKYNRGKFFPPQRTPEQKILQYPNRGQSDRHLFRFESQNEDGRSQQNDTQIAFLLVPNKHAREKQGCTRQFENCAEAPEKVVENGRIDEEQGSNGCACP